MRSRSTDLATDTTGKALDALAGLGIVRELTGQKRNRVYAYIRILNQEHP